MEEQNNEEREGEEVIHVSCNFMTAAASGLNLTTSLCMRADNCCRGCTHREHACL